MRALLLVALFACATLATAAEVEVTRATALQRISLLQAIALKIQDRDEASPVVSGGTLRGVPHPSSSSASRGSLDVPKFPSLHSSAAHSSLSAKHSSKLSSPHSKSKHGSKKHGSKHGKHGSKHGKHGSKHGSKKNKGKGKHKGKGKRKGHKGSRSESVQESRSLICRSGKNGSLKCPHGDGHCCPDGTSCCPAGFDCDGKGGCLPAAEESGEEAAQEDTQPRSPLAVSASRTASLRGVPSTQQQQAAAIPGSSGSVAPIIVQNNPESSQKKADDKKNKVTIISNDNTLVS